MVERLKYQPDSQEASTTCVSVVAVPPSAATPKKLPPPPAPQRVLVVVNGPKPEIVRKNHGSLEEQIRVALDRTGLTAHRVIIDVVTTYESDVSPLPEDTSVYAAVILGGSKFDVTDRAPWMLMLEAWIQRHVGTVPLLGICFGHQIIAHALGGEVANNPKGPEAGTYTVARRPDAFVSASADPIASRLPASFPVHLLHGQSVVKLPPGAVSFYDTALEANQLVRFAPMVYGAQFHPEFTPGTISTYVPFTSCWRVLNTADKTCNDTNCHLANDIIGRFVALAIQVRHDLLVPCQGYA
jgi:GMP synthase (glutamine-hydrolysing)